MKRFLALFLCVMMVLSLAPAAAFADAEVISVEELANAAEPAPEENTTGFEEQTAEESVMTAALANAESVCQIGETGYASVYEAFASAVDGDTVTMIADSTETATVALSTDKSITLDLNGFTLKQSAKKRIIEVSAGKLTIQDSSADGTGRLYGNSKSYSSGHGINITGGTVVLNSGTIEGCKALATSSYIGYGGGVQVKSGTFEMNGGTIKDCTATESSAKSGNGGGVALVGGNFTMNGGTITGCTADSNGGSIYSGNDASVFTMNGGTISGKAVTIYKGTLIVNGGVFSCSVTGSSTNKTANGGWFSSTLVDSTVLKLGTGKTATGACSDAPDATAPYTAVASESYSITYANGTVEGEATVSSDHNAAITLPAATTEQAGKNFAGWNTLEDGTGTGFAAGDEVEFAADSTTLYAQWASDPTAEVTAGGTTTTCYSFADAINKACESSSAKIVLLADVETDSQTTVTGGKNITVDLNGHSITNTGDTRTFYVDSADVLTITDSSDDKDGIVNTSTTYSEKSGTTYGSGIFVKSGGTLKIEAGTFNCRDAGATSDIYSAGNKTAAGRIEISGEDTIIIGKVGKSSSAVVNIEITGGWFSNAVNSSYVPSTHVATGVCVYGAPEGTPYTVKSTSSEVTYTVSYDVAGGTEKSPTTVNEYEAFTVPEAEKEGSVFGYWTVGEDTETRYNLGDEVWFNGDVTLKANWVEEGARVITGTEEIRCGSFENALTIAMEKSPATIKLFKDVEISASIEIPTGKDIAIDLNGNTITSSVAQKVFSVTGILRIQDSSESSEGKILYTNTDSDKNGKLIYVENAAGAQLYISSGNFVSQNEKAGSDIYIYTKNAEEAEITTFINISGGIFDAVVTKSSNAVMNVSGGWFRDAVAAPAEGYVATGLCINNLPNENTPYTVRSTESELTYTVTYDVNGGTEMAPEAIKENEAFTLPAAEKDGSAFDCWSVGEAVYEAGAEVWLNGDVTLKAGWTDATVKLTIGEEEKYFKNVAAAYAALPETLPEGVEAANITLLEDNSVKEQLRNDCPVVFNPNGYTISLEYGGAENVNKRIFGVYDSLTIAGFGKVDASDNPLHYVAYVGNNQTLTISGNIYFETGKSSETEYNFFSKGTGAAVEFTGEDGSSWFNATIKYDVTGDASAVLVENPLEADYPYTFTKSAFTLTYDANGGEESSVPASQSLKGLKDYDVLHDMRVAVPFRHHDEGGYYVFDTWNTKADGSGDSYPAGGKISISEDTTLYAQWKQATDMCAAIGEELYPTLGEALSDAKKGETVTLLKSVTETVTVGVNTNAVLDLNGFEITGSGTGSTVTNSGTLVIKDSSGEQTGKISGTAQSYGGGIENSGTLTLEGGEITGEGPKGGGGIYVVRGTLIVKGGTVSGTSPKGSAIYAASYDSTCVVINGGRINGSIFKGAKAGMEITDGLFSEEIAEELVACGYTRCDNTDEETKTDYPYTVHDHNSEVIVATFTGNNGYSIDNGLQIVKDEDTLRSTGSIKFNYSADGETLGEAVPDKDISLTLTGVTYDNETGDLTPASEKAGAFKIVAKLASDPLGSKKARSATVTGKTIAVQVASFDYTLAEGETALEAGEIAIDAADVKAAQKVYTVTPKNIKDEAGNEIALEDVKFTYTTGDSKVAAVNSKLTTYNTITVPKGANGQTLVSIKASANVAGGVVSVPVAVMDCTPRLFANAVTFDTQKDTTAAVLVQESYGNAITGVEFGTCDKAGNFTKNSSFNCEYKLSVSKDMGSVWITVADENNPVLKNATVSGVLRFTTDKGYYTPAFKITVKNSAPSVTAKVVTKFNKFYTEPTSTVSVSVKGLNIENVELKGNDNFTGSWDDGILTVSRAEGKTATTGTVTLSISLEGYANPVTKALKLTDETRAPTLVLDHTSSTLYEKLGTSDTFTVSVKGAEAAVNITNVTTTAKATVAKVEKSEGETNKFKVTILDNKGGSVPVAIEAEGWTKAVTVKPTVKVSTKDPATKLDKTKLTLNKAFGQSGTVAVSIDQTALAGIDVVDNSGKLKDILEPAIKDDTVTFTTGPETTKGTYKFDIIAKYEVGEDEYSATKQTVSVTVNEVVPKVTMTKVTINSNYDDSALLTAKVGTKGYELVDLGVADGVEGFAVESKDGKFYLTASGPATTTKSVALKATLSDADGNKITVNSSVAVAFVSKDPAVTTKSAGKLDMITRNAGVTFTVSKIANLNAKVAKAELGGTDAEKLEISELTADSKGLQQFTVTLKDDADVKAKDKLSFTLTLTLADLYSGSELARIEVKQTQTVSESKLKVKTVDSLTKVFQSAESHTLAYMITVTSPAGAELDGIELNEAKIKDATLKSFIKEITLTGTGLIRVSLDDDCYLAAGKSYTIPVMIYAKGAVTPTLADLKFSVVK